MSDLFVRGLLSGRVGGRGFGEGGEVYKFERIKRARVAALAASPGGWVIDLGVGEPDGMADGGAVGVLGEAAGLAENRGYADNGGPVLKRAAAGYLERVFGVGVDWEVEVLHSMGSKAALSILPLVLVDPGDFVLMTSPGYPVFGTHTVYCGGRVFELGLRRENGFLPDLGCVPKDVLDRAKVLVLNYPNNPTGACATREFFVEVVGFARRHGLVVVHDAAYGGLVFDGAPLSFLSTPGAMEVGVELHSTSKVFNMTGWRCGFVAGNGLLVKAYGAVKDNTDSGQFLAVQAAAAYCFERPEITEGIVGKYRRRMEGLVGVLRKVGFDAVAPGGSFFLYVPAPKGVVLKGGERVGFGCAAEVSEWLIRERLVSTVPWDEAGSFLRFSVTFAARDEAEEGRVLGELERRLGDVRFEF